MESSPKFSKKLSYIIIVEELLEMVYMLVDFNKIKTLFKMFGYYFIAAKY